MNNTIKLTKNQTIRLTKMIPYTETAYVALGWKTNRYRGGRDFDLDLSLFILDENRNCLDDKHFVWFQHKFTPENCIAHSGDDRNGNNDSDAEVATMQLSKMPDKAKYVSIVVTIFDHGSDQHFGLVDDAYIRILNKDKEEKVRFNISEEEATSSSVSMRFGEFERVGEEEWEFKAIGEGSSMDLEDYIIEYGLDLQYIFNKYCK